MEETSEHDILSRHQSCSEERIEVLSNTIERCHSSRNTPAYCIPKVVRMETGEVKYEKVYASPRPPPKISLTHDWMKELGSEVAQRPEGQVVQQSKSSQSNQLNPSADHDDRTGQPVVGGDPRTAPGARKTSLSQEIETRSFHEEAVKHDRTGHPWSAVTQVTSQEPPKHVHLMKAQTSTLKTKQIMIERGHPLSALKEEQGHSNSSLETTKQNWICRQDPDHSWIG